MSQSFYSVVSNIIDRHIPVKQLSRRELKLSSRIEELWSRFSISPKNQR